MKALRLLKESAADPRLALMLPLGFSSGLPFLLIFSTQSAWLSGAGVPPHSIGLMSWCLLAFSFKFLWAPIVDRYDPPGLTPWLGRRRAWMLIAQLGIAAGLASLAFADPTRSLLWSAVCGSLTGFAAATQDITIDAWRIDAAPAERQGLMVGVYSAGYRVALISAGAGALYLSDRVGWRATYLIMATLTLVGMAACLAAPRLDRVAEGPAPGLGASFAEPLADLLSRYGAALVLILLLVAFYRMPDFLSGVMAIPLYKTLGFTNSDIATASKLYGVWVSIAGTLAGGWCVARAGLMPTLLVGGIAAPFAAHLSFVWLTGHPQHFDALIVAVSCDNFATGFAGAALIAYMSSLVAPNYAATQYALFSSVYALPGKIVGGVSGYLVEDWGYPRFFTTTALIGIPVAILCVVVWRLRPAPEAAPQAAE